MKQSNKKRAMTDREKVIRDMISAARKNIIAAELELEFLQQKSQEIPEPETQEDIEGYNMMMDKIGMLDATIKVSIEKLNFLKQKRTDFHVKNAMKDYHKFPAKINENELIECEDN